MIAILLACFPARWRARYGDEFVAMLEARPLRPYDVADILLAALDARLRRARPVRDGRDGRGGRPGSAAGVTVRVGARAAAATGVLWLGIAAASALRLGGGAGSGLVILVASIGLLVAIGALSAAQSGRHPRLVWIAVAAPLVGATTSVVGLGLDALAGLGAAPPVADGWSWVVWMVGLLAMVAGSGLFAAVTLRVGVLSRPAAAAVLAGSLLIVPAAALAGGGSAAGEAFLLATIAAFGLGWLGLGASALGPRGRALEPSATAAA